VRRSLFRQLNYVFAEIRFDNLDTSRFERNVQVRFFRRHALALDDGARAVRFCQAAIMELASAASRAQ
jgi:hypothetical protein